MATVGGRVVSVAVFCDVADAGVFQVVNGVEQFGFAPSALRSAAAS